MILRRQFRIANFGGSPEYGATAVPSDFAYEYTQPFSAMAWFKGTTANGYLITNFDSVTTQGWAILLSSTGTVTFMVLNTSTTGIRVETTGTFHDGSWHQALCCYDGSGLASGVTIYVDGVAVPITTVADTLGGSSVSTSPLSIGSKPGGTGGFVGAMAPAAVWDKKLSAVEAWGAWNLGVPGDLTVHPASANLQGYWRLGELGLNLFSNTGMTGLDESGHDRHLRFFSMETTDMVNSYILGQPFRGTKSLTFDGTKYVTMGDVLGLERTDAFTISCWVKGIVVGGLFVAKKADAPNYEGYAVGFESGQGGIIAVWLTNHWTTQIHIRTTATYNDGLWHHVAFTYSGNSLASGVVVYVDGSSVSTTTVVDTLGTLSILTTASLNIGGRTDGVALFTGAVNEVVICDKELSSSEILEVYADGWGHKATELSSSDSLIGYWRMGEHDVYPIIADRSINSNDGTMVGMVATDITGDAPTGTILASSRYSTGSLVQEVIYYAGSQWSDHGDVFAFERTDSFSVSFWIYPPATGYEAAIIGRAYYTANGRRGWSVHRNSNRLGIRLVNTYSTNLMEVLSKEILPSSQWTHCVVTYNGNSSQSGVTLYLNGQEAAKNPGGYNTLTGTILPGPPQMTMGALESGLGWKLVGHLAQVSMWNKELSAAEALETFGGDDGRPVNLMDVSCSPNLVFWSQTGTGDGDLTTLLDNSPSGFHGTTTGITETSRSQPYPLGQDSIVAGRIDNSSSEVFQAFYGGVVETGADNFDDQPRQYFRMRGWNTVASDWEAWTSVDEPDPTPPVGPCINVSVTGEWS